MDQLQIMSDHIEALERERDEAHALATTHEKNHEAALTLLERERAKVARLRERVREGEGLLRSVRPDLREFEFTPAHPNELPLRIDTYLAAADTNNEDPSPAQREAGLARPSGASQDAGQPVGGSSPSDSGAFAALRLACANEALRTEPRDGKAGLYRRIMAIKIPSDAAPALLPDSEGGSAATDLPEQRGDTPGASANSVPSSPSDREALASFDALPASTKVMINAQHPRYCYARGWQASRAALPTRDEIADAADEAYRLPLGPCGGSATDHIRMRWLAVADAILALIGGDDE